MGSLTALPDASFPSDHLTLWWAVALGSMTQRCTRSAGAVMASAWLSWRVAPLYMPVIYSMAQSVHLHLFGALIRRGWVRE